jgi:hypothetical protein
MAIGANSYGSVTGVGALVPRWSGAATDFAATTRPTLAQVEGWIDQISAILNSILAQVGFTIPVSQATVKSALGFFVNEEVAAIVEGVNGSGRFGPTAKAMGKQGRFALILGDVEAFLEMNTVGFERLGAARNYSVAAGIGYRETNNAGDETTPIFSREGFGNRFTDWDPE